MPKISKTITSNVSQYINEFPNETFKSDDHILLCVACETPVSTAQRSLIIQHKENIHVKKNLNKVFSRQYLHLVIVVHFSY